MNQWHCLEESGQWLENVDQTHQVLVSGNILLQKVESKTSSVDVGRSIVEH